MSGRLRFDRQLDGSAAAAKLRSRDVIDVAGELLSTSQKGPRGRNQHESNPEVDQDLFRRASQEIWRWCRFNLPIVPMAYFVPRAKW